MKVRDLIAKLHEQDPEAEVWVFTPESEENGGMAHDCERVESPEELGLDGVGLIPGDEAE